MGWTAGSKLVAVVALSVAWIGTAIAQEPTPPFDHAGVARQVLDRHIRPGIEHLAEAARDLDAAMGVRCRTSTPASRATVERAFDAVVSAWGRIEVIAFGPIARDQRLERFLFWPDRRGIGARQLAKALRERDPAVTDVARLREKSVAVQGLAALDTLLFEPRDQEDNQPDAERFRCAFARAITANLAEISASVAQEWVGPDGYAMVWLSPGPGNGHYLKPSETTLALAKALDRGLEMVRDQRIAGPLGLTPQRRRTAPILAKSGRTMRLVAANIEGLRALYVASGLEKAIAATDISSATGTPSLAHLISAELATAHKTATELLGLKSPFDSGRHAQRLIALGFPLKNARVTANALLARAAGLPIGFNASDGD